MSQLSVLKEKLFSKEWFMSYGTLVLGTFVLSLGYTFFMLPYKITPGGVYGISIVLNHKLGVPIGMTSLCFNIPLTILGLIILGPRFGIKTVVCFVLTAAFCDTLPLLLGTNPLQLDDEVLLASIFGGLVMGVGVGLIFKTRASSGGTDVLAAILNKYTKIPLGKQLMIVDTCVVLIGFIAFKDWKVPFYSWLTIFIMGQVIDVVIRGFSNEKTLFIISEKSENIRKAIINDLQRGGTILEGKGMYTGAEKEVLMSVVSQKEVVVLQQYVHKIDPDAFMMVMDASEILGKGFKSLSEKVK